MSDTTPTPRSDESTPLADETAREHGTGEQPLTTSPDPADHTDTAEAPVLPPEYRPVSASEHVAPQPAPLEQESDAAPETSPEAPAPVRDERVAPAAPAAAPAEPVAAPQAAPAASPEAPAGSYAGPTYLQSPTAPKKRGNRGLGILIAVLAAVVFAAADLAAAYGVLLVHYGDAQALHYLDSYARSWSFWLPLAVFTAAFIALVAIVNRGRWWGYVLGSVFVAALVFAAYYAAALLTNRAWHFTPGEFRDFTGDYFQSNIVYLWVAVAASFIALETVTWFGAWIAFHGQNAKRRNAEARAAYEEELERSAAN
jgi:hypothetical protein